MTTSALWLPCTQMQTLAFSPPLSIVHAKGALLFDKADNSYLDAISSWWVNIHGHCHSYINEKIKAQLDKLEHTMLAGVVHPQVEQLAERLVAVSPASLSKVFFADSGSAAIECALKMSLQYWHQSGQPLKKTFVSLQHGYHGETLGSLSVTDIPLFSKQYAPLLINHLRIASPANLCCPEGKTQKQHEESIIEELNSIFSEDSDSICAFIVEPLVQGAVGMAMYSTSFLQQAKQLCKKYHIHLIADEIAVGFGRTGTMFACEQANISPDFMCLSKGLTAGYLPMSCVLTTDDIYAAFLDPKLEKAFLHSHSFTGNPLAAAAANASLDLFEQQNTLQNNQLLIQQMKKNLDVIKVKNPHTKNHRQTGMIAAFTIDHAAQIGKYVHEYAKQNGVLVRPIGNEVYVMPPYCITIDELDKLFTVLDQSVEFAITQAMCNQQSNMPATDPKLLA